jgi:hypothetical protein
MINSLFVSHLATLSVARPLSFERKGSRICKDMERSDCGLTDLYSEYNDKKEFMEATETITQDR